MGKKKLVLNSKKIKNSIDSAIEWLLKSGIQNTIGNKSGSVNAWYDVKKKKYSFIYSEINGYFITMMIFLYKQTNKKKYLNLALLSAKWLSKYALHKNGGFKCLFLIDKTSKHAFKKDQIYSFDNGVILNGFVSLYKITKKKFLLNNAIKCGNWLTNYCIDKNDYVKPVYEISENKFYESDKEWSLTSSSYHTKIATGLINLYSITKNKKYLKYAKKICERSLQFQTKNGRFISFPFRGGTNAHPHCYSAEGLWSVGKYLKNKKYLNSSYKATKWILSKQNSSGKIPRLYFKEKIIFHERVDAIAQVIRLSFLNSINSKRPRFNYNKIMRLVSILMKYQNTKNKNLKIRGSFYWGKTSYGEFLNHPNSWVTFFCIQALFLVEQYNKNKKINFDSFDLV